MSKTESSAPDTQQELDALVSLAEDSTTRIDQLVESRDRAQMQFWLYLVGAYFAVVTATATLIWLKEQQHTAPTFVLAIVAIGAVVALIGTGGLALLGRARRQRVNQMRRDEMSERAIQHRLVSLIDDQMRRVEHRGEMSALALATLEIRLRRLDRSESRNR